jgi:hypothetical protein
MCRVLSLIDVDQEKQQLAALELFGDAMLRLYLN